MSVTISHMRSDFRQWYELPDGTATRCGDVVTLPDGRAVLPSPMICPTCRQPFTPGTMVVGHQACRAQGCNGHTATTCLRINTDGQQCDGEEFQPPRGPDCERFALDGRLCTTD